MDREAVAEYAEIFGALADETRLHVLVSIMETVAQEGPVSYSAAMEAAGLEDSGLFNYHLGELQGNWLYQVEDRYAPTTAAWELYMTLGTGRLGDNDLGRRTAALDVACMRCGGYLQVVYDYEFIVWCPHCRQTLFRAPVGPAVGGDADLPALARTLDSVERRHTTVLLDERCQDCAGEAEVWVGPSPEFVFLPTDHVVLVACEECGNGYRFRSPGQYLLVAPAVVEYAAEHGIDLFERPQWAYEWARSDEWTVVRQREPLRLEQHAIVDGCRLVAIVEEDGSVSTVDHVPLDGAARGRGVDSAAIGEAGRAADGSLPWAGEGS